MNDSQTQFLSTREETIKWLDRYGVKNYTINDDLSVDVSGNVNISNRNLQNIPVKFGNVTGNFDCSNNHLVSLAGSSSAFALSSITFPSARSPKIVGNNFWCNGNKLTSLVGSPKTVGGDFGCNKNQLINLIGSPEIINGDFWCSNNKLTSFTGSPKSVGGDFDCDNNLLVSVVDSPEIIGNNLLCNNKLISLTEIIYCNFREYFCFNIDIDNFKQKELIQILKKYYHNYNGFYILTHDDFNDTIKPHIEKYILQKELNGPSKINPKTKNAFI